jgi:hypothetical protein
MEIYCRILFKIDGRFTTIKGILSVVEELKKVKENVQSTSLNF